MYKCGQKTSLEQEYWQEPPVTTFPINLSDKCATASSLMSHAQVVISECGLGSKKGTQKICLSLAGQERGAWFDWIIRWISHPKSIKCYMANLMGSRTKVKVSWDLDYLNFFLKKLLLGPMKVKFRHLWLRWPWPNVLAYQNFWSTIWHPLVAKFSNMCYFHHFLRVQWKRSSQSTGLPWKI